MPNNEIEKEICELKKPWAGSSCFDDIESNDDNSKKKSWLFVASRRTYTDSGCILSHTDFGLKDKQKATVSAHTTRLSRLRYLQKAIAEDNFKGGKPRELSVGRKGEKGKGKCKGKNNDKGGNKGQIPCKWFKTSGGCSLGDKCLFLHQK